MHKILEVEEQMNEIMQGQLHYDFEQETSNKENIITKYQNKLDALYTEEPLLLSHLKNYEIQLFTLRSEKAIYEQFIDDIKGV